MRNKNALPRVDDLFNQLHGSKVFLKIDLRIRYHQSKIKFEDVSKAALRMRYWITSFGLIVQQHLYI